MEIKAMLGKLRLHYPMTDMPEAALQQLWGDYCKDLGEYPAHMLQDACDNFRRNDSRDRKFFPHVSDLLALIRPKWLETKAKLAVIEKLLSGRAEKPKSEPIPDEMWKSLKDSLRVGA